MREKRNFSRVALRAQANITHEGKVTEGEVENLSMNGVFIRAHTVLNIGDLVSVTIYQPQPRWTLCDLKAKVMRTTEEGVGLQFEKTLLD